MLSAVGAAYSSREQGIATADADKRKATTEALNAQQQQINMRQKMMSSLAAQNAGTLGAVGTGRGTGFGANAMRQITQNQNDLMITQANESSQVSLLDQAASNAEAAGTTGAVTSIVEGGAKVAGIKDI
jgi:hypothetical protein